MSLRRDKVCSFIRRMNGLLQKLPTTKNIDKVSYIRGVITSIISSTENEKIFGDYFLYVTGYNLKRARVYVHLDEDWRGPYISKLYFGNYKDQDIRWATESSIDTLNADLEILDYISLATVDPFDLTNLEKFKF